MDHSSPETLSLFSQGIRDELPLLIGVIPFGFIFAILARQSGFSEIETLGMSLIIFAGSSQFLLIQLASLNTPILIMVLSGIIINLRHLLYSISIAPYTKDFRTIWKIILSYLLTDEAYAVAIAKFQKFDNTNKHWYFLGAGFALWFSWQFSTLLGVFIGTQLPSTWSLDFALPLTFIALVIPMIKDRPGLFAALSSGIIASLTIHLPYKFGLILAAIIGVIVGLWSEE